MWIIIIPATIIGLMAHSFGIIDDKTHYGILSIISAVIDIHFIIQGNCPSFIWQTGWTAYMIYQWWKHHRNGRGKKALKELGAKSRARVEALVRNMTPSPLPSPAGA